MLAKLRHQPGWTDTPLLVIMGYLTMQLAPSVSSAMNR